jgi:hypothetical protein
MDRKEMLMRETLPKRPEVLDEAKLSSVVDEAAALAAMCETRGWKILHKKFIEPRTSIERIFNARGPFRRAEEIAAVKELDLLMKYIMGNIEDGQKANTKLDALKKK